MRGDKGHGTSSSSGRARVRRGGSESRRLGKRRRRRQRLVDGPRRQRNGREPLRGGLDGGGGRKGHRERRWVLLLLSSLSRLLPAPGLLVLLLPLGRRPPQREQLRGPRVQRVLEPLDPAVVELDLLPEAGELAVALGEAGGQLFFFGGWWWGVVFCFSEKSEFFLFRRCGARGRPDLNPPPPPKKKRNSNSTSALSPRS